jgi:hypothetical protein
LVGLDTKAGGLAAGGAATGRAPVNAVGWPGEQSRAGQEAREPERRCKTKAKTKTKAEDSRKEVNRSQSLSEPRL